MSELRGACWPARAAAGLAFASAAVSCYWTAGGAFLLDTVGGAIEELARERSLGAVALGAGTVVLNSSRESLHLPSCIRRPTPFAAAC